MLEVYVSKKNEEAVGTCSFELSAVNGAALPAFAAGAHVDVLIAPGLTRQYSLCNSPEDCSKYLIAVLHEPESRGGSRGMHLDVQEGSKLTIGVPRNLFALDLSGDHYVLFAGGIGITPILAMAHTLVRNGKSFELHYCGRSIERLSFLGLLNEAPFAGHVHVHVDNGAPEQRLDASAVLASPSLGKQLYMCGPSGFMNYVQSTVKAQGWSEVQIHREDFAAAPVSTEANTALRSNLPVLAGCSKSRLTKLYLKYCLRMRSKSRAPVNRESAAHASPRCWLARLIIETSSCPMRNVH